MDNTDADTGLRKKTVWAYTEWAASDCIKRMAVALYIYDGWDSYWAFPNMPKWLRARYWTNKWSWEKLHKIVKEAADAEKRSGGEDGEEAM